MTSIFESEQRVLRAYDNAIDEARQMIAARDEIPIEVSVPKFPGDGIRAPVKRRQVVYNALFSQLTLLLRKGSTTS